MENSFLIRQTLAGQRDRRFAQASSLFTWKLGAVVA
jgi:hypothetical protein